MARILNEFLLVLLHIAVSLLGLAHGCSKRDRGCDLTPTDSPNSMDVCGGWRAGREGSVLRKSAGGCSCALPPPRAQPVPRYSSHAIAADKPAARAGARAQAARATARVDTGRGGTARVASVRSCRDPVRVLVKSRPSA